jgi:uncharacterized protein (DUF1501 family)
MNTDFRLKTRREFLRTTILGGALAGTVPAFLARTFDTLHAAGADAATQTATGKDSPILVVVQLAGGNDGLNTVVPLANDDYLRARPVLHIAAGNTLRLSDDFGLHPAMTGYKALFDAGHLAVVHGTGYPNPNRSHFRSTEIWQTASDATQIEKRGWLGRYFDHACAGAAPTVGISLGFQLPQAFAGQHLKGVSLVSPERFRVLDTERGRPADNVNGDEFYRQLVEADGAAPAAMGTIENSGDSIGAVAGKLEVQGSLLDYIERVALAAEVSSEQIRLVSARGQNEATYPASALANGLKLVARLIVGGMTTRVYYVSQGGYDTHTGQAGTQQRLLGELAGAVSAFATDLKAQGNFDRVLLMTFSEFGRRLAENASGGTDHGAAAPLFLVGGRVKAGLLGRFPSLAAGDLFNGDPRFTVDFRSVYAAVLEEWLKTPSAPILGQQFDPMTII